MLLPFAFLPFMTRKPSRWLLVAPLYVMNLISDYQYQYDLGFQYSFGSGALLVYLAVINLADMLVPEADGTAAAESTEATDTAVRSHRFGAKQGLAATLLLFSVFSSAFLISARMPSHAVYADYLDVELENANKVREILADIDRSKSVTATSMYLTPLYDVDELYHTSQAFNDNESEIILFTDVVVLDARENVYDAEKLPLYRFKYAQQGYETVLEVEGLIVIMERKQ